MEQNPNNGNYCKFSSQLRYDLVSKDWVVVAVGRGKKPEAFKSTRQKTGVAAKDCVFCNLSGQFEPKLVLIKGKVYEGSGFPPDWTLAVIPNKFPSFYPADKLEKIRVGKFYQVMNAAGFCEVIVTRDHDKHLFDMEAARVKELIDAYQMRYNVLKREKIVNYISIFHNYGPEAGASQPHPHSQIITSPFVDTDFMRSLSMAKKYYKANKSCIYCEMNKWELKEKVRLVFENKDFMAVCPFASKTNFETIISPKKHTTNFENVSEDMKWNLAEAFRVVLAKIRTGLDDPSFNFYLHTAPADESAHPYYHWHWTIFPKTGIQAGFEMGTKMEITSIEPEAAAEYLRKQNPE